MTERELIKVVAFRSIGRPQQRGSKRALPNRSGGRPLMVDSNKKSGPWMAEVRKYAADAWGDQELLVGPVAVSMEFHFRRPKSHYGTGRNAEKLKGSAPTIHTQTPDLAKLIRCLEDALTGVIWRDDRQVCEYLPTRRAWTTGSEGADVTVYAVT